MAKSGRRPPDLRDTLGSLVQSAIEQVGVVREVVERGAQAQRNRYDTVKFERRRKDALAALGEVVYRKAVRGDLGDLGDDPEVQAQLEQIDSIDQRLEQAEQRGGDAGFRSNAGWPKQRRGRGGRDEPMRVWRPVPPFAAPDVDEEDELDDAIEPAEPPPEPEPERRARGAGIAFGDAWDDDDDDLEEYMHEDDVPEELEAKAAPKPKPKPKAKAKPRKRRAPKKKKTAE